MPDTNLGWVLFLNTPLEKRKMKRYISGGISINDLDEEEIRKDVNNNGAKNVIAHSMDYGLEPYEMKEVLSALGLYQVDVCKAGCIETGMKVNQLKLK